MIQLILLLIYLSLILCVIFLERKTPTEALLWVLVLVCLPYAGAILYLIFGNTIGIKLTAFARGRRLEKRLHRKGTPPPVPVCDETLSDADLQVLRFNSVYNGSAVTSYTDASLYTCGADHYTKLFEDIKQAKECIYIEFYTIHHDLMGEALVKALTEKANQGITVLVMCDFFANLSTPPKMFRPLVEAGGQVVRCKPYLTHYRSHRKIVVIDHQHAYIGGMNIGKQYANMHKKKTPWRDTQVRLEGECTAVLENYFLTDWLCSVKKRNWEKAADYVDSIHRPEYPQSGHLCQFIVGGVDNNKESAKMCYLSMIRSAKKSIRIQTPYFIPDSSILDALKTAAAAGVQIQLMIPGISAGFFLDPVTTYYSGQLLQYGAKVYRYNGYIHAKTMVIDDELCCIGSVNMDMRSLMVDDEICGVFYPNAFANQYSAVFDNDILSCTEYTREEFDNRPIKDRISESVFLPFAPLM